MNLKELDLKKITKKELLDICYGYKVSAISFMISNILLIISIILLYKTN